MPDLTDIFILLSVGVLNVFSINVYMFVEYIVEKTYI